MSCSDQDKTLSQICVPSGLRQRIVSQLETQWRGVSRQTPDQIFDHLLGGATGATKYVDYLTTMLDGERKNTRVLEIGSGFGFGLCQLVKDGYDVVGVEPGHTRAFEGRYYYAKELLSANGVADVESRIQSAVAEKLPFPDRSFDIVFAVAVLEHVQDVKQVVKEAIRVAVPGGAILFNVPNYDSYYEGHYGIPWLPYVLRNRRMAGYWVKHVFRRDPGFLGELNFITRTSVRRTISRVDGWRSMETIPGFRWWRLFGLSESCRRIAVHSRSGVAFRDRISSSVANILAGLGLATTIDVVIRP